MAALKAENERLRGALALNNGMGYRPDGEGSHKIVLHFATTDDAYSAWEACEARGLLDKDA